MTTSTPLHTFYLHHDEILFNHLHSYCNYLSSLLLNPNTSSNSKTSNTYQSSKTHITLSIEEKNIPTLFSHLLHYSHPFYAITNSNYNKCINLNFYAKEYVLYNPTKEQKIIPYIYLLLFKTLKHLNLNSKNFLSTKTTLKIIDPHTSFKSLPIEFSLYLQHTMQRINAKKQLNTSLNITTTTPKKDTLSPPFDINSQFTSIVQNPQQLKQLKEESTKARTKLKLSQIPLDFLDAKFKKNDFHITTSILLETIENAKNTQKKFEDPKEFKEFISHYLYQAEFITSQFISLVTPFKIPSSILKKYNLTIIETNHLTHPFDETKKCFLYLLKSSKSPNT